MALFDVLSVMPDRLWTEGPTPTALQEVLDKIDEHAEQVRTDLFLNILRSASNELLDESTLLALAELAAVPSASGTEQWVAQCATKYLEIQKHVALLQAELKAAQAAADLEATLSEFRGYLENGQFNDAAFTLVQLRKILEDSTSTSSGNAYNPELQQLQQACAACTAELDAAFESSFSEAFEPDLDHGWIMINSLPGGADARELWEAMENAQLEERHIRKVADTLLQHVLPYVLNGTASLTASIAQDGVSAQVTWHAAHPQPDGSFSTEHVEQSCMQLLAVLAEALFRQWPSTLAAFGEVFWSQFVQAYQAAFLQQVQGSSAAVLQERQAAAKQMEQQAVMTGLAQPGSDLASCLSRAIQESYHVVQEEFLAAARELLLAHDPHAEPVTVGEPLPLDMTFYQRYKQGKVKAWEFLDPPSGWDVKGPVLANGYYQVSNTVMQLVIMIDDALSRACHQGNTSTAQAIVNVVSKMAAMFGTMLPAAAAADAPVLALQRHNDLQYLSNHLLTVPYLFGDDLNQLLGSKVWLGDDALRLRGAARAAFFDTLSVQAAAMRDALAPVLQLSASLASGKPASGKEAQAAASSAQKGALYTLRRAGKLLWSCLAPTAALEASTQLLEELGGLLVQDVLARKDIGNGEDTALVQLYRPLVDGAVHELLADVDLSKQTTASDDLDVKELVAAALYQRCNAFKRLAAVLELLEAKLAGIVSKWESGELMAAGLALREVEHMVLALFEDTDYRAQCLQRMEAAQLH
eukprot:GHUV01008985.1.p1 GENE.GHUV01008985.1~~GHUV01008985.1.p1  ORF type:complete len:754 (+),score=301.21 GHUV01008985.1:377-2638(+)